MFRASLSLADGHGHVTLPRLRIPTQDLSRRPKSALNRRQLQDWLETLGTANTAAAAEQLSDLLGRLNATRYSTKERLQHHHQLRPVVAEVCDSLLQALQQAALPLDHKHRYFNQLYQQLSEHMAAGYKMVVSEMAMDADLKKHERMLLAEALYLAVEYLARRLLCVYSVYQPEPAGVWADLNQLYQYAEDQDLQLEPVDEPYPDSMTPVEHTVDLAYKRVLMLALAQPYHLMQYEAPEVFRLVQGWAASCQLHPQGGLDADGLYAIDLESDRGPRFVSDAIAWGGGDSRLIDVSTFTEQLEQHLQRVLRANLLADPLEPIPLVERRQRDMLLRLSDVLNGDLSRRVPRFSLDARVQLCAGLNACHHFVSEGVDFTPHIDELKLNSDQQGNTDEQVPLAERFAGSYRHALQQDRRLASGDYTLKPWWQQNVSPVGIALQCSEAAHTLDTRVGELVAYRAERKGFRRWQIGVIRWLQIHYDRSVDGSVHVGVMNLANGAVPVGTRAVKGPGAGTDYFRSLMIPRQVSIAQTRSLVVPALLYDINTVLAINTRQRLFYVRLTRLLRATGTFAQFAFDVVRQP